MVTLDDIRAAQQKLRGVATRTPLLQCSAHPGELWLKPESLQPIGSFKLRGAYNKIASLSAEERARGVIAYSSGNHAQGVAYAARAMGVKATIVIPAVAPALKIENTRALGAEVVLVGPGSAERQQKAEELAAQHGYAIVPPFDDEKIIAGQGTIGLEILEDLPDVELVLSPVSGGGLIAGIATAIKLSNPKVKVIGVEPELAADAQASLRSGSIMTYPARHVTRTIADGLRSQAIGERPWEHIQRHVDDIITVSDSEIREAVRRLARDNRLVIEPSGAATYATFLFHRQELPHVKRTAAVLSGGNIDPKLFAEIIGGPAS